MSNETTAGPYKAMAGAIYGPGINKYGEYVEPILKVERMMNAAYAAGQASREHFPDMVDRVTRICKETLNAHGYDFPLDHDTPAMLNFRTRLAPLLKTQP